MIGDTYRKQSKGNGYILNNQLNVKINKMKLQFVLLANYKRANPNQKKFKRLNDFLIKKNDKFCNFYKYVCTFNFHIHPFQDRMANNVP